MMQHIVLIFSAVAIAVTSANAQREGGSPLEQVPAAYRGMLTTFLENDGRTQTCGNFDPGVACETNTYCNEAADLCLPMQMNDRMKEIVNKRENKCPPLYTDIPNTEQCYFYGPRRCNAADDCWNSQTAGKQKPAEFRYVCQDLSSHNGISGKRCFRECNGDSDCPSLNDNDKVSGKVKNYMGRFYGCHERICQLKKPYSHIIRFAKNILGVNRS